MPARGDDAGTVDDGIMAQFADPSTPSHGSSVSIRVVVSMIVFLLVPMVITLVFVVFENVVFFFFRVTVVVVLRR